MVSGYDREDARLYGAIAGVMYQTYSELQDGFSLKWGFSPSDMAMNFVGASLFYAQMHSDFLQNIQPKWGYVPPQWARVRWSSEYIVDNYNSTTFWYAFNVHRMLPDDLAEYWPRWLRLSVGYGVDNLNIVDREPNRYLALALDYDLGEILPEGLGSWNWLRQSLSLVKLPSPAIKFGPETKFYLLFPIDIRIGELRL
jgi:hypothetical protein